MFLLQFSILFLISSLTFYLWKRRNEMPGPNFLTNIFCGTKITDEAKYHLFAHYLRLARLFGPVFRVTLDGRRTVVVTDPELAHAALVGRPDDFAGRPRDTMFKDTQQESNDLGTSSYNDRFRRVKKAAGKALWGYMSRDNLEKRVKFVCDQLSQLWSRQTGPFDPSQELAYPGVGVCLGAMFNTDYSPDDPDYCYVRDNMAAFVSLDTTGGGATKQLLKQVGEEYPAFMRAKIDQVASTFTHGEAESIVEHLLVVQRENRNNVVGTYFRDNMQYLLTDMMGGNITVHSTLIWMVFFMAKYQTIQDRVYEEIVKVIGVRGPVTLTPRPHMPYTQAVLQEIMRRGTVTPIGFPHTTTCHTELAGYKIPKDTDVTFHFYAYHHDPRYFPQPETFNPERFLRRDVTTRGDDVTILGNDVTSNSNDVLRKRTRKLGEMNESNQRTATPKNERFPNNDDVTTATDDVTIELVKIKALMPFSAGRRKCPAEMVARPELFMILCHLVRRWKIKFAEGEDYGEEYAPSLYSVAGLPGPFRIQPVLRGSEWN